MSPSSLDLATFFKNIMVLEWSEEIRMYQTDEYWLLFTQVLDYVSYFYLLLVARVDLRNWLTYQVSTSSSYLPQKKKKKLVPVT